MPDDGSFPPIYSTHRWAGPVCWLVGLAMIIWQGLIFFHTGILSGWLIGTGVALLLGGNVMLYWTITDRRSKQPPTEDITAEQFDAMLDEVELLPPDEDEVEPDKANRTDRTFRQ